MKFTQKVLLLLLLLLFIVIFMLPCFQHFCICFVPSNLLQSFYYVLVSITFSLYLFPKSLTNFKKQIVLYTRYLAFLEKWENILLDALYLLFNWVLTFCIRIISWMLDIKNLSIADWIFLYDETTSFILYNIFLFLMVNNWLVS